MSHFFRRKRSVPQSGPGSKRPKTAKRPFGGYYVWYNANGNVSVRCHSDMVPTKEELSRPMFCAHYYSRKEAIAHRNDVLTIYTDGSSRKGNQESGYAVFWGVDDTRNTSSYGTGTNNYMEACAIIDALEKWEASGHQWGPFRTLRIYTDSNLTISATQKPNDWFRRLWEPNGERHTRKNYDLYERIVRLQDAAPEGSVDLLHVRAHVGIYGNERADQMASGNTGTKCIEKPLTTQQKAIEASRLAASLWKQASEEKDCDIIASIYDAAKFVVSTTEALQ